MSNFIVSTSIYEPTEATVKFCQKNDWQFIMVADKKTPVASYKNLEKQYPHFKFFSCEEQELSYPSLSAAIGWNSIDRRNIGFVEALRRGAEIIATVDDDNIPYESWGKNLLVGKEAEVDVYTTDQDFFDPLSVRNIPVWHRGYPIQCMSKRQENTYKGKKKVLVHVQADLWDGDPDIDAIAREMYKPNVKFENFDPYTTDKLSPFNSQNTFLHKSVFPNYMCIPHIGRMDDIWGGYLLQMLQDTNIVYCRPSVYQERNPHQFMIDFNGELIGYTDTLNFKKDWEPTLPANAKNAYEQYRKTILNEPK